MVGGGGEGGIPGMGGGGGDGEMLDVHGHVRCGENEHSTSTSTE
jgi:hypothetical protein